MLLKSFFLLHNRNFLKTLLLGTFTFVQHTNKKYGSCDFIKMMR
jgi:hypothetical protein